jgi:hypothetical protein
MRQDANWCVRIGILVLVLAMSVAAFSCGGGGKVSLDSGNGGISAGDGTNQASGSRGTGQIQTVQEDEVASLPGWIQDLLSDPGWNQPYIQPRANTALPAPSSAELLRLTQEAQANPPAHMLRPTGSAGSKGASWNDPGGYTPPTIVFPGEYETAGAQPYGCVSGSVNGHAREDNLATIPDTPNGAIQVISYALNGLSDSNHFNADGGQGTDAESAVYQLYASARDADPTRPYDEYLEDYLENEIPIPDFGEASYRADGGPGAGDACDGTAYVVEDFNWWEFNSELTAIPGTSTALYNVLIAPSNNRGAENPSDYGTGGRIQSFYLGTVSNCYGGGAIVGLFSAEESCAVDSDTGYDTFDQMINDPATNFFFTNPIYGVALKRWYDAVPGGADLNDPAEENSLGWPVFGPVAYNGGVATLTAFGAYYAWGWYFEKGFMWWADYVNNGVVPDEGQVYEYTGANVYCVDGDGNPDGVYVQKPTVFYGGVGGALGVSVAVDASLNPDLTGSGGAPAGSYYQVSLPSDDGLATVTLNMFANGYGGTPNAACDYKHYTWAFRDGSIGVTNSTPFSNSTKHVSHTYGNLLVNVESVYIVRVQVVDAADAIAYGDSLPIHIGHGTGGGSAEVWLVDDVPAGAPNTYRANYDAIVADLTALGVGFSEVPYSDTLAADFDASGTGKVVIWYRGGPGAAGEPNGYATHWANPAGGETDNYIQLMKDGHQVLLMSQSHGFNTNPNFNPNGWTGIYSYTVLPASFPTWNFPGFGSNPTPELRRHMWAASHDCAWGIGFGGSLGFIPCAPNNISGSPDGQFGPDSTGAAERNTGGGSSGQVPIQLNFGNARQFTGSCYYGPLSSGGGQGHGPGQFVPGVSANPTALGFHLGYFSWGNNAAPDENLDLDGNGSGYTHVQGPGKLWSCGYGWAETQVASPASMTRADLLRNILSWLNSSLTFSAVTNAGFEEYEGIPEIVSVTPAYWDEVDYQYRSGTPTPGFTGTPGGVYPDQTGSNAYRTTNDPAVGNEVITTDPNNDWTNGNDVDFQFPGSYCYLNPGANGVIETWSGVGAPPATDDTVLFLRGFLMNDVGAAPNAWTRFSPPPATPRVNALQNYVGVGNPIPEVCGYYFQGNTGDNGAGDTMAQYGTEQAATTGGGMVVGKEYKNGTPLTVEAIAHWSQSLKYGGFPAIPAITDAVLNWSMYPGHNMQVPGAPPGTIIGLTANWDEYRKNFNNDPTTVVAGRGASKWNQPVFNFRSPLLDPTGRVVEFNYRKVKAWNPDLNRDGAQNNADKFPVRCRLFANHQGYVTKLLSPASVWPNNMADPGVPPPAWYALVPTDPGYPSFIEGGCYVVDAGDPVYNVQLLDDPAQLDPGQGNTLTGFTGNYLVDFYYIIRYGVGPYTMEADFDYNGVWNSAPAGRVVAINNANILPERNTPGVKSSLNVAIPAAIPNSPPLYNWALRVTDSTLPVDGGPFTSILVYNNINLTPPPLFRDTMSAYANTGAALAAGWTRGNPPGNVGTTTWYIGTQYGGAFNQYQGQMWHCNNGPDGSNGAGGNYNTVGQAVLCSPNIDTPVGGTKTLFFRCAVNFQEQGGFFDNAYTGFTVNDAAATTEHYFSWSGGFNQYGIFNQTGTTLDVFNRNGMNGPGLNLTWELYTLDSVANVADGLHLDAITLENSASAPPGW